MPDKASENSDRKNYFWHARQNVRQDFSTLLDILSPCQTFFPVDDWQILVAILVFLVGHFMCIEPCWTKCLARSELSAGHQQKSARHVQHILRSLENQKCPAKGYLLHPIKCPAKRSKMSGKAKNIFVYTITLETFTYF